MPQISKIKYSDILEARRYDAEFFKPEFLKIESILKTKKCDEFKNLCHFIKKGIFDISPLKYKKDGIPFLRVSNTKSFFINTADLVFLDEQTHNEYHETELELGDIILSKVGTLGDAVINLDYEKVNISQNNIGIKIKHNLIDSGFVAAFLNSKYGKGQIRKKQSGQVQDKLVLDDIKYLQIPRICNENEVGVLVKSAYFKKQQSKQLYQEAEQLLLQELGLLEYIPQHQLTFSTTKKEIDHSHRYDAEYFQPKYYDIIEKIENYQGGWDIVENIFHWKKGIEVGTESYTEDGKNFIRVSDFSINGIQTTNKKISEEKFHILKKNFQPKQGDILFTKDGTIGISYHVKEKIEGILSGAFLRLTLKKSYEKYESEALTLILNSIISKLQIEQLSGGALIAHLKPSDFGKIKIPLIRPEIQSQIAQKIQESYQLRKESKQLLEDAKRMVEEEIEKA